MNRQNFTKLALVFAFSILFAALAVSTDCQAKSKEQWQEAKLDNIKIFYQDIGNKNGIPLVFIHGWTADSSFWKNQIPVLEKDYRLILIDLPGFGRSDKPQNVEYTMQFFAKAIKAVLDDAKVEKPVLIGHSMGYAILRQYLIDYPSTVRAIVNVDGAYFRIPNTAEELTAFEQEATAIITAHSGPNREQAVKEFIQSTFYGKTPAKIQEEIITIVMAADPYAATSALKEMFKLEQWTEKSFDVPALAIYAEAQWLPPNHEEYMRTVFPNLTYIEWNDTGHFLMLEKPERFNKALTDFLKTLN